MSVFAYNSPEQSPLLFSDTCAGLRCKDSAAEASQSDPGSSWHWEDCHLCHYRLPPVPTRQRVRHLHKSFTVTYLKKPLMFKLLLFQQLYFI